MQLKYLFFWILITIWNTQLLFAASPKRELRAVWIATVGNIDWPSQKGLTAQQQQTEFINHLNFLKMRGFNAVIVQVRPAADAFFESEYEPWSRYLSGKQGQPPFPKYDPLEFIIEETHKRNMEFHAWFNPFRALVTSTSNPNPATHVTKTHPNWVLHYGGKGYLDPGNIDARAYVLKVIMEAVSKYDIDAVHIDDYFYPYRIAGKEFPDDSSYNKYKNGMTKDEWRRNNVNLFISQLNILIKNEKPWVKLGISPFGVWRNANKDPRGSKTTAGQTCYDDLYSDILLWMDNKWIDYIAPQLYWEHGHKAAPFEVLLPWWKQATPENTDLYIGLGLYRMLSPKPGGLWDSPNEIIKQIKAIRSQNVPGIVMYSMSNFNKIKPQLADSLAINYFGNIAIPPAYKWNGHTPPQAPVLQINRTEKGVFLSWEDANAANCKYLIYKIKDGEKINLNNTDNIIGLTGQKNFIDKAVPKDEKARYVVTCLDRGWNESGASNIASSSL